MSKSTNITMTKRSATTPSNSSSSSETVIGSPLSKLSSDSISEKTVIIHRRSASISKFTIPFTHVDSMDLYRSKQPKSATITKKLRKLCQRIFGPSEVASHFCRRNTKGDVDDLELGSEHEEIRAEVETLVRKFSLRFGLEVRERTASYEATRAEMAEERRRREERKVVWWARR